MKSARLPSLIALRAFEAVARVGSMKKASTELNVTPGAISQLIKKLEDELSLQLFDRKNREIVLTEAGQLLRSGAFDAFKMLKQTVQDLSPSGQLNTLSIACDNVLANNWLAPRLAQLQALSPEIDVEISAFSDIHDVEHCQTDIVLSTHQISESGYESFCLGNDTLAVYGSPAYINKLSYESDLLSSKPTFLHAQLDFQHTLPSLSDWLITANFSTSNTRKIMQLGNQFSLALTAAKEGTGLLLAPSALVAHEESKGQLVQFSPVTLPTNIYYWVGMRANHQSAKAVYDWLIQTFTQSLDNQSYTETHTTKSNVFQLSRNVPDARLNLLN